MLCKHAHISAHISYNLSWLWNTETVTRTQKIEIEEELLVEKSNQNTYIRYNLIGPNWWGHNINKQKGHIQEACTNAVDCVQTSGIGLMGGVFVLQLPEIPITESILRQQPDNIPKALLWLFITITSPRKQDSHEYLSLLETLKSSMHH